MICSIARYKFHRLLIYPRVHRLLDKADPDKCMVAVGIHPFPPMYECNRKMFLMGLLVL